MRKLKILKSIIELLWILSLPLLLILIVGIPGIFFIEDLSFLEIFNVKLTKNNEYDLYLKLISTFSIIACILIILSFHYFKKILQEFYLTNLFSNEVIKSFSKIGSLLLIAGCILIVSNISLKFITENKFTIQLISPEILCVCMGLFFEILAEIFNISSKMKQDNELTI